MANYDQKNYNKNKPIQTPKPCEMLVEEDYVQRAERVIKGLEHNPLLLAFHRV